MVGYEKFCKEQVEVCKEGKLLGIGFFIYIEVCGIVLLVVVGVFGVWAGLYEVGQVRVQLIGKVSVFIGVYFYGQGYEMIFV